jgi:TM2 domain-containing membrane protein YozV
MYASPAAAPPGTGWWMAADGRWYPPQAPPMPAPAPGWAQGPDGQWYQVPMGQPMAMYPAYGYDPPKSKAVAALLAFVVGGTGAHNFYLGRTNTAVIQLCMLIVGFVTALVFIGFFVLMALSIWVFIEFILILTGGIPDGQNRPLV